MSLLRRFALRLRAVVLVSRLQREMEEEMRAHLEQATDRLVARGLSRADARVAARREFGNLTVIASDARAARGVRWSESLVADARLALRALRRSPPAFTIAAVLALALGIGATTAILSVVDAVLLAPLPYADAGRLVVALHEGHNPVAPANFADWRAETHSFTDMAAAEYWTPALTGDDNPEEINGLHITSGMLPMLGVHPLLGRVFTPDEDQPGSDQVVILSYGLWQRRFAGARDILDRSIALDGRSYRVVGVMPESFRFAPFWATRAELWAPLALGPKVASRTGQSLRVFARLRPGITLAQARADLAAVTARLEREYPGTNRNVELRPLRDMVVGNIQTPLIVLLVAVGCVLLIACANVAHMLLARSAARQRELAVRTALGATRARLVAQLLIESLLLAALGGAAGLGLAIVGVRALVAASPAIIPRVATVRIDFTVLLMVLAIIALTTLIFGLLPALRAARVDLARTFRDGDRSSSSGPNAGRLRGVLVASEFALALVLLVGAGLMIRSFIALQRVDPGFDPRNVVSMIVSTSGTSAADASRHAAFYVDALERVRALPEVASASYVNHRPFDGDMWGLPFRVEERPHPAPGAWPTAVYRVVFPGYFATMRVPILRGRDVVATDRQDTPGVVVINEFLAQTYWPGQDAIGKRITLDDSTWLTVVGVAKNIVRDRLSAPPAEELFLPFFQQPAYVNGTGASRAMTLVARVRCLAGDCDAARAAGPIRTAIRAVERNAPLSSVATMSELQSADTAESRFYLVLLGAFATVAVVLAAVGIYGVTSYSVSRRTHEIGIRIALGAEPAGVVRRVVGQGLVLGATGAAVGIAGAFALTRLMRGILFGVSPSDVLTQVAVTTLLLAVAAIASLLPALRAARVDPLIALRSD